MATGRSKQTSSATKSIKATSNPTPEFEISEKVIPDEKWSYYYNDERVTMDTYNQMLKDHDEWTARLAHAMTVEVEPEKKKRKTKK